MSTRIELTDEVRRLIKLGRTDLAGLSQKGAALAAGDMSDSWWRQIETGVAEYAAADTLARMAYAVGITPDQMRATGQDEVADLIEQRLALLEPEPPGESDMERHLMATPGLTDSQRRVLVSVASGLISSQASDGSGIAQ